LDDNSVRRVVNDCGIDDDILILSQFCVLFTGMAGRLGFVGMTSARFVNRFFSGGHSHYFESQGKSTDQFMARYWVPLITGSGEIERADERKTPGVMQGVMTTLLQIADPIKLLLYVAVIWWLLDVFFFSPYRIQVERANTAEMNVRLERSARELVRLQKEAAENKTRQVQAKVDIEAQLQSDALSKIDRVRAMAFDDKALPPSMQLSVLSNLEWLAGEYIRTDFDKSVINAAGKAFLDDYLRVLGRAGYQGDIVITARTGRPCLSRDEEYQEAEPGVEISQCATTGISKAYAMKLSQRRADAVKAYLVSRGMPANRIYTEGVGDRPVVQYPQEGLAVDWNRVARLNSRIDIVLSVGK
jgi:outer membrane protein OmpA-like peptidoglycan-associated protein